MDSTIEYKIYIMQAAAQGRKIGATSKRTGLQVIIIDGCPVWDWSSKIYFIKI